MLRKFVAYPRRLTNLGEDYFSLEMWHETNAQKNGTIRRECRFPVTPHEMILSGPHLFVANPCYKTPRANCTEKGHFDILDLEFLADDYLPRTNYVPACDEQEYNRRTPVVPWLPRRRVTEYFRFVARKMLPPPNERTLAVAILAKDTGHTDGCFSIVCKSLHETIALTAMSMSLAADFFVKSTGKTNFRDELARVLPSFQPTAVMPISRTLALNCLTRHYTDLWQECWDEAFRDATWLGVDPRLDANFWRSLTPEWTRQCALRSDFSRRWALVELDVFAARTLGLTLAELQTIYRIQFPVLRQYEADTWYDQKGRIVFTCSKGLPGVGLDRAEWNEVRNLKSGTVKRTVTDNTLPTGPLERELTWYAPFSRCDREVDYATVWRKLDERG